MPTPDTLRWAATELRREADALVPTITSFIDALGPTVWSGRKADETRSELESERHVLAEVALELESLAVQLEQRAQHDEYIAREREQQEAEAQRAAAPPPESESGHRPPVRGVR